MKKFRTSLETVVIMEVAEGNFALYKENAEGGMVAIVMPGKKHPEIYGSLAEAQKVVDSICMVVRTEDDTYARAFID